MKYVSESQRVEEARRHFMAQALMFLRLHALLLVPSRRQVLARAEGEYVNVLPLIRFVGPPFVDAFVQSYCIWHNIRASVDGSYSVYERLIRSFGGAYATLLFPDRVVPVGQEVVLSENVFGEVQAQVPCTFGEWEEHLYGEVTNSVVNGIRGREFQVTQPSRSVLSWLLHATSATGAALMARDSWSEQLWMPEHFMLAEWHPTANLSLNQRPGATAPGVAFLRHFEALPQKMMGTGLYLLVSHQNQQEIVRQAALKLSWEELRNYWQTAASTPLQEIVESTMNMGRARFVVERYPGEVALLIAERLPRFAAAISRLALPI